MKVYRISVDTNRYQYFLPEREEDVLSLLTDCTPRQATWTAPPVFIYKPKLIAGDFYNSGSGSLITNPYATDMLATFLEMAGELLPLPYQDQTFTLLNVTECINCLDHDQSAWLCDDDGMRLYPTTYVFYPLRFSESRIFKIPETCSAETLVVDLGQSEDEELRSYVERAQLRGLVFTELWSDEA